MASNPLFVSSALRRVLCSAAILACFALPGIKAQAQSQTQAQAQPAGGKPQAPASAKGATPKPDRAERGWFFFDDPKQAEEEPQPEVAAPKPLPRELPKPPDDDKCLKKETWSPKCGFVDPGTDFNFQAQQRDALMEQMVVSRNDPKAVEAFQYYMRWALQRTSEVTNLWYYNMVQNPDLDPTAARPVNSLGLRMMTDVKKGRDSEFARLLAEEGAFLIFFSRHDCSFCHTMAPLARELGTQLGIPVRNAALDDKCIPSLEAGCITAPRTEKPAQALQVSTVPTVFLYVPDQTFIRIATGVTDVATMRARTLQFFQATRTALLRGVDNGTGSRPSVDFSTGEISGATPGIARQSGAKVPSPDDMARILGATP